MRFLFFIFLFSCTHLKAGSQDHFKNFSELSAHKELGIDYAIEQRAENPKKLVMAFHGGLIEPGTSELGLEISRAKKFSFYTFKGLTQIEMDEASMTCSDVHLTSTNFDEPNLLTMIEQAQECLTLHGFGGDEADFCVGGANEIQRRRFVSVLSEAFPHLKSCELCCPPYNGTSKKNPANRCSNWGVQVEMSPNVRKAILENHKFRSDLAWVMGHFLD